MTVANPKSLTATNLAPKRKRLISKEALAWWMFCTPAFLLIIGLAIYPLANTINLSFHRFNLAHGNPMEFIGFGNYARLVQDPRFLNSMWVTFKYTAVSVSITMVVGFAMALLLNQGGAIIRIVRGVSLMPMLIAGVALSVAWMLMYNPNFGVFNMILSGLGLPVQNWLGDPSITIWAMILIEIWQFTPFVMILSLAGFQSISPEYYEAAYIDGASRFNTLRHITLPLMRNILLTILIIRIIDTFRVFEKPRILTNGGPLRTTETINLLVFTTAFEQWDFGFGSAGSVFIAVVIAILTAGILMIVKVNRSQEQ